ncbi:hypothetical protein [Streptomyces sp. NPDC002851]
MFSGQKIAAVSGLLGSLAVIYVGAGQAYAAQERPGDCKTNARGETTCQRKNETTHTDKHGKFVVKQSQKCSATYRPRLPLPKDSVLNPGTKKVGPVLDCTNKVQLPKGFKFKRPHFLF